jgi:GNAT superfamily N-acetyltransferase
MEIIGPNLDRAFDCEAVLRSLPMWFGIERALLMYARDTAALPTFALVEGPALVGFLTLREHFPEAWDIHCVAIRADARGHGNGSRLLAHAEAWLRKRGVRFLQVKTVAATSPSKEYAETREFYDRRGFTPIEIFPTLWDPHNPALQYIKVLNAASPADPSSIL